uniref:MULE domain-containing protein n=1 Tax=Haemonchus placei TaxID=6290 RepID=A0A0N4WD42_HAEPC
MACAFRELKYHSLIASPQNSVNLCEYFLKKPCMSNANITGDAPERVVLDFERAAIEAALKVFPRSSVERCSFHLAQGLHRKRRFLGVEEIHHELEREEPLTECWEIVKGT